MIQGWLEGGEYKEADGGKRLWALQAQGVLSPDAPTLSNFQDQGIFC